MASKLEILKYHYESFIGTRLTCQDWEYFEIMDEELKECILLSMTDYADQELKEKEARIKELEALVEKAFRLSVCDLPDENELWNQFKKDNGL